MGCKQTSRTINPQNQIPIERILVDNRPVIRTSPGFAVSSPSSTAKKGVLKKTHLDRTSRNKSPFQNTNTVQKTVNFDQQVTVKPRTPTPNKTWYEKTSSTVPMKTPPYDDDDDDDDYDIDDNTRDPYEDYYDDSDHLNYDLYGEADQQYGSIRYNTRLPPLQGSNLSNYQPTSYSFGSLPVHLNSSTNNTIKVRRRLNSTDIPRTPLPLLNYPIPVSSASTLARRSITTIPNLITATPVYSKPELSSSQSLPNNNRLPVLGTATSIPQASLNVTVSQTSQNTLTQDVRESESRIEKSKKLS